MDIDVASSANVEIVDFKCKNVGTQNVDQATVSGKDIPSTNEKRVLVGNTKSRDFTKQLSDVYAVNGRGQSYTEKKSVQELNCCNALGLRGSILLLLTLAVTVFHWTILFLYASTKQGIFTNLGRPYVWLFLLISIVFTILLFWVVLR